MADYTIDRDAPKLDLLGEKHSDPKPVLCKFDDVEMNYHLPTDQWQCPQCGATSNGGKPQSESTDNGDSKEPHPS